MTRYFELYVPGHAGYSCFVKTGKELPARPFDMEGEVIRLAVADGCLEAGDARDVEFREIETIDLRDEGLGAGNFCLI